MPYPLRSFAFRRKEEAMEDYRTQALAQAAELIAQAAGEPTAQRCRMRGDWCASPAAFALAARRQTDPERMAAALARKVDLTGSWFDRGSAEGGYVNLRLAPGWYAAVARAAVEPGPAVDTPVPPVPIFPAAIDRKDWRFLCRSGRKGRVPEPALAARQDDGNPVWRVRYTAWRMGVLAARRGTELPADWSPEDRTLLQRAAEYPARCRENGPALGRYLAALAQLLWQYPGASGAAQMACARVLTAGYGQLTG